MRRDKLEDPIAAGRDEVEATDVQLVEEVRSGALKRWRYYSPDLDAPVTDRPARSANGRVRKMARD